MNNRIAKKILCCSSTLHKNQKKVYEARTHAINNYVWFLNKGIHLIQMENDKRNISMFWEK